MQVSAHVFCDRDSPLTPEQMRVAAVLDAGPAAMLAGCSALAMPLLAPLADFAQVSRATTITAWIIGHGLALIVAPTSVVLVGGLAIAKVGYDRYLRFVWPLWLAMLVVSTVILGVAASLA